MTGDTQSENKINKQGFSLGNLQIITATLVAIFGAYTSWQSHIAAQNSEYTSNQFKEVEQETERIQEFSKRIQDQLPNLTDISPAKAKIALASLYALASDESDKSILFTVAIASESEALRKTIYDLILSDTSASDGFKKDIGLELQKRLTAQSREAATKDQPGKVDDVETEVKLLQQLTSERPSIRGWLYLGKAPKDTSALVSDKTIKSTALPNIGETIEADTSINLRDSVGPRGKITGVIARNSKLKIEGITKQPINAQYDAIWADVSR